MLPCDYRWREHIAQGHIWSVWREPHAVKGRSDCEHFSHFPESLLVNREACKQVVFCCRSHPDVPSSYMGHGSSQPLTLGFHMSHPERLIKSHSLNRTSARRNFVLCRAGSTTHSGSFQSKWLFFFNRSLPLGIMRVIYKDKRLNLIRRQHSLVVNKHPCFKSYPSGAQALCLSGNVLKFPHRGVVK